MRDFFSLLFISVYVRIMLMLRLINHNSTINARDPLQFVNYNYIHNHRRCKIRSQSMFQIYLIINSNKRSSIRSVLSVKSLRIQRVSLYSLSLYVDPVLYFFFLTMNPVLYNAALLFFYNRHQLHCCRLLVGINL